MPWPTNLTLPNSSFNAWEVDVVWPLQSVRPGLPAVPIACLLGQPRAWPHQPRVADGTRAFDALFGLDGSDQRTIEFVTQYGGLDEFSKWAISDVDDLGWLDTTLDGQVIFEPEEPTGNMLATWASKLGVDDEEAMSVWAPVMIQHRHWDIIRDFYPFDQEHSPAISTADLMAIFGGWRTGILVPIQVVTLGLLRLRAHLLVTMHDADRDNLVLLEMLVATVRLMLPTPYGNPPDITLQRPDLASICLHSLWNSARSASSASLQKRAPRLLRVFGEDGWTYHDDRYLDWTVADHLFIELFNDLNDDFKVKVCANPDCGRPFTRQTGQSFQRQSRRDAKSCSKSCADRVVYLRKRAVRVANTRQAGQL